MARDRLALALRSLILAGGTVAAAAATLGGQATDSGLVLVGATIYVDPKSPPIRDGVVIIRDGKIAAVGPRSEIAIPSGTRTIDLNRTTLVAGFWNSHVHLDEWTADTNHAARVTMAFREMFTRWGFTTVVETGGDLASSRAVQKRIKAGEVAGPRIFTAADALHFDSDQGRAPERAAAWVDSLINVGSDGIKVYAQEYTNPVFWMQPDVLGAVVTAAHRRGVQVFAHPTAAVGLRNAVNAGVDVIVHTTPAMGPWGPALVAQMMAANIALIPTLKLWPWESAKRVRPPRGPRGAPFPVIFRSDSAVDAFTNNGVEQLREYFLAGGTILFGTDVGYMTDYSTLEEFELMARAGMGFRDILASLTTAPVAQRKLSASTGRIAVGFDADLVVLRTDPARDVRAFAEVLYTIRGGRIIFGPISP